MPMDKKFYSLILQLYQGRNKFYFIKNKIFLFETDQTIIIHKMKSRLPRPFPFNGNYNSCID